MTVEACVAFCGAGDFIYAGVEFATQCYCDSTIQIPGAPSPLGDCNTPCAGNASEFCGGGGEILIYTNGEPGPVIVQEVGQWSYEGCFTILERVLSEVIDVPAGVTAETCTAGCQTAGFTIAGLEDGQECWCGNTLGNSSLHVDDDDCREICISNHDEYCGNANRLAIYEFAASGAPPPPTACSTNDITNFTLVATAQDGLSMPLKVVVVEMVPSVTWTILTVSFRFLLRNLQLMKSCFS
ncbi:WSC-domain-containing protein [Gymnopus androsaceus JB14]|uniref:WSC-domain-containing protein n=1 Tax=Gymnopus androsaceus JB14 TaxID=1447944 RepID=A0A6A4IA48_9AGAR|nr:WSC-domain-containing protein [Gymnopus androsaceus JB14]